MAKAKDPICGMTVDTDRAPAKSVSAGGTVYFCSTQCQKAYEARHPS
jgi:YHS domain-containing protein